MNIHLNDEICEITVSTAIILKCLRMAVERSFHASSCVVRISFYENYQDLRFYLLFWAYYTVLDWLYLPAHRSCASNILDLFEL